MTDAIFQVRTSSVRFPAKAFKKIEGKTLLWHVVQRVKTARLIDRLIIATTDKEEDDRIEEFAQQNGLLCYRGSERDVLDRYYQAAKQFGSEVIVRITPDDPFKDPQIIDQFVSYFVNSNGSLDYVSNTIIPSYPEGIDLEVFSFKALERAWIEADKPSEREHVTPYIWKNSDKFQIKNLIYRKDLSNFRWTIDYPQDMEFTVEIYKRLYPVKKIFLMEDILEILEKEPDLQKINDGIMHGEGYLKSLKEDKLQNKNKKI
ncbi:MAG: glycosyltransferase family protein [Candidatus Paceibacterota bacterium]|jgi:spore coat polysaccharide biosynthesis protein SpsF